MLVKRSCGSLCPQRGAGYIIRLAVASNLGLSQVATAMSISPAKYARTSVTLITHYAKIWIAQNGFSRIVRHMSLKVCSTFVLPAHRIIRSKSISTMKVLSRTAN
uniref:Chromosome partitioning protein ParB n=1 Tax=uncultured marine virus TaxID=186617 RepID=A0A0F7L610_9VIRU|nr:chromosome partitioning protein ParB [uncultured marine virus]